ncbi:MAG: CoA-binding protein [Mariprofundaceae bacterium]
MNWKNPDDGAIQKILGDAKTIAVVGCSPKPERASHQIAEFLLAQDYHVIPVHPKVDQVLGQKAYATLGSIPEQVDIVDVFRKPEATPDIARDAVAIGAQALWLQQGIVNEEAWRVATKSGLTCVMDRCIAVMHRLLMR